jgi:hypothetical protein
MFFPSSPHISTCVSINIFFLCLFRYLSLILTGSKDVRSLELNIPRLHTAPNTGKSYLLSIHINTTPRPPPKRYRLANLERAKRHSLHFINADGNVIDLPNNGMLLTNFPPGLLFLFHTRADNKEPLTPQCPQIAQTQP